MEPATFLQVFLLACAFNFCTSCRPRDYGWGSVVCVCDSNYCDFYDGYGLSPEDDAIFTITTSTKAGLRFDNSTAFKISSKFHKQEEVDFEVAFNRESKKQVINGFGGAFTDAASLNYMLLSEEAKLKLVRSYYNKDHGIAYTMGRVPMGGADFSWRLYTYVDEEGDVDLSSFALQEEDELYKIPFIHAALLETEMFHIDLIASPWSAPAWMKTNNQLYGQGKLKEEYYQIWANYFVRFFEEYFNYYIDFWAFTGQNEPMDGLLPNFEFNCMGWTAEEMRIFIKDYLGPTVMNSSFANLKLITVDDQRANLPLWTKTILGDEEAARYVDGVGVHWYVDGWFGPNYLDDVHDAYPDKFLIYTEACEGDIPNPAAVVLGSWERGEHYGSNIMEDLNHWVTGWVDWNLALDPEGGPNWAGNNVDAAIIVNATADEFYKQPMFYMLGHYSKFIPPESYILSYDVSKEDGSDDPVQILVASRPDGSFTSVILNESEEQKVVRIVDTDADAALQVPISGRSITSVVWKG